MLQFFRQISMEQDQQISAIAVQDWGVCDRPCLIDYEHESFAKSSMLQSFPCPYLNTTIELTQERIQHITETHPGTLPDSLAALEATLADPDLIRASDRDSNALLFSKWFETIRTGRYLVVVVVNQTEPQRHWIVTIYTARRVKGVQILWQKN